MLLHKLNPNRLYGLLYTHFRVLVLLIIVVVIIKVVDL